MEFSSHGVSFPRSGLSVGKARCHSSLEDALNETLGCVLVHHLVVSGLVEGVVKPKVKIIINSPKEESPFT